MNSTRSRICAAVIAVVGFVFLLLPAGGSARAVLATLVGLVALLAAATGLRRLPSRARDPFGLVVGGLGCLVVADTVLVGLRVVTGTTPPFPGPFHLLYPLGALLIALGLVLVVRPSRTRNFAVALDALLLLTSVGAAVGILLVAPSWGGLGTHLLGNVHLVGYPAAHLLLLVALVRFAMTSPWDLPAARALGAGALAMVLTAGAVGVQTVLGTYAQASWIDLGWMLAYVLLAVAVRHPTATAVVRRTVAPGASRSRWRLILLTMAALCLPATALAIADDATDVAIAAATALLLLLLLVRVDLHLIELRRSRDRDLERATERGHRRLEAVVRHASDALLVLGSGDRVSYATPSARELFGDDPTGWRSADLIDHLHPDERDTAHRSVLEGLVHAQGQPVRFQTRLLDRDDVERYVEVVAVDLTQDPDVGGVVLTFHDNTDRIELERRLRHLAFHDPLTGLCNRELLQDRLVQALGRAARDRRPVAVLVCDLDDFKDINDTYGHATGDALLTVMAERLSGAARATDTVARLGGDEFAILCEGIHGHRDAIEVARRVLAAVDAPVLIDGLELRAGVSIGVAVDDGQRSGQELLRDADIALYEAKSDGKQRWSVHRRTMTERAHARLQLATDLARAVELEEIEVAYQPIVSLSDERIVGIESLARWEHPELGWVSPADFIPLAEETGQINRLGDIVLRSALGALRTWLDIEPELDLRLGVNVSGRQMRDPDLPVRVACWLQEFSIDPQRLVLELTESVMIDEADEAIEIMEQLRRLGVRFAVDDFGTGYSSLAYLRRLPVDIVKTDRAFVRELGQDEASSDLVRAVIEMARSLHLDVVAEGVETVEQRDALLGMGCAFAQGFLFARPVAAAALTTRLLANHSTDGPRPPGPTPVPADVGVDAEELVLGAHPGSRPSS